mmetsp:Transcript_11999/g.18403  ORF Transcript_11999/g.18403 Transcript_11999/m.18403 type:complete len:305 (+) Transcript_11999:215-1129(+)|eukprot:CAMPEP_0201722048 /NCGR_PEP_ID=MMETSP0593-20130828/6534_1 /ASSEMBLY_ACC=CAM_ASM_000672 /TAXON_ID=267983 /ORGANISM="Skeletonema japonicum, Strain CCMP2506" /LENGTH=304 /DNA_ID=CAMNT_0048212949 /DNA_START=149 /DNA_END=1063 /DNA_ORIENTATION=+
MNVYLRDDAAGSMMEEDLYSVLSAMLRQEEEYQCHGYLEFNDTRIDETCRTKMTEWVFQVVDCTRLQRETASVSIQYLDRFMCTSSPSANRARLDRKEYQLVVLTTLYIATKIFEPFVMDASLVSSLSRGVHSEEEIVALEYEMLVALHWRVNGPTPLQFVNYLLELLPTSCRYKASLYEHSHFQTELSIGDCTLIPIRRSVIAVAAILNSLENLEKDSLPQDERIRYAKVISMATGLDIFSPVINSVRIRLLDSFSRSSGYSLAQVGILPIIESKQSTTNDNAAEVDESPVCVMRERAISLEL